MQNQTNLKVNRTELKFLISNNEYISLFEKLKHILDKDIHSRKGKGYFIRSLYFDSHNDKCLFEKQGGIMLRKKFRMRIYDFDCKEAKFEIKNRLNNHIFKETATITRSSAINIIKGNYEELLKYNNELLNRIYTTFNLGNYKPKVVIDYYRDAFKLDLCNTRITVDKNIEANNANPNIFSKNLHTIPIMSPKKNVLEIKYDKVLPEFLKLILQLNSFEKFSFSKYVLSRRLLKKFSWEDN